jgi:hypothetical protein
MGSNEHDADRSHRAAPADGAPRHGAPTGAPVDDARRPSVTPPGPQFMTSRRTDWRTRMWETSPDSGSARPQVHDLRRVLRDR